MCSATRGCWTRVLRLGGLAVGTVARAYRELEGEGLLVSRRGGGTRVAPAAAPFPTQERQQRLADLTASYIARARALGASDDDIRDSLATLGARGADGRRF